MVQLSDHPTVQRMRAAPPKDTAGPALPLDADWLRMLCLEAGADDVGFASVIIPTSPPTEATFSRCSQPPRR